MLLVLDIARFGSNFILDGPTSFSVSDPPVITSNPVDGAVIPTDGATSHTFTVGHTGGTSLQWEYSDNGTTWFDEVGATSASLVFLGSDFADDSLSGRQFRCVVTNTAGSVTSLSATLTIGSPALIPVGSRVSVGKIGAYLIFAGGFISPNVNEVVVEWLVSEGIVRRDIGTMLYYYLGGLGYGGTMNERLKKWRDAG